MLREEIWKKLKVAGLASRLRSWRRYRDQVEVARLALPMGGTVVVVSPHPDDESIGCGGTLKLLARQGCAVHILQLTRGGGTSAKGCARIGEKILAQRESEARVACKLLGVTHRTILGGKDGSLEQCTALVAELEGHILALDPALVLCPWPHDQHGDHQAAARFVHRAMGRLLRRPELWLYEVWTPLLPNRAVDISGVARSKREAICSYHIQIGPVDHAEARLSETRGTSDPELPSPATNFVPWYSWASSFEPPRPPPLPQFRNIPRFWASRTPTEEVSPEKHPVAQSGFWYHFR